jgi:very-short-patch-repair endonuclease
LDGHLIVELDGEPHKDQKDADENRSFFLGEQGFKVLRFWNTDVLTKLDDVCETILHHVVVAENPLSRRERAPAGRVRES